MTIVDWRIATNGERKVLFKVVKDLVRTEGTGWDWLYEQAFGHPFARGLGFEKNFSDGRIARFRAKLIYDWLVEARPRHAALVRSEIERQLSANSELAWPDLVEAYGAFGYVTCIFDAWELVRPRGVDLQRRIEDRDEHEISLNEAFQLVLNPPITGHLIGIQSRLGKWKPLPLCDDVSLVVDCRGETVLPPHRKLVEEYELGPQRIVLVIGPEELLTAVAAQTSPEHIYDAHLNRLASLLLNAPEDKWVLACIDLKIVPGVSAIDTPPEF